MIVQQWRDPEPGLLRKFQDILPRTSLITIYKSFARPHHDYGDIKYDQTFNESFHQRIESIQYNAAIAITGAITGTSSEKLYQELGLESLRSRRWFRKLCLFSKIYKNKSRSYLYNLIPDRVKFYSTRSSQTNNISNIKTRSNFFRNSFFRSTITEWNKLDRDIRNSDSLNVFKVNKSVHIASRTYRFCWQYAIILVWKTWSSLLNQLNR